jgi:hypothetical protein
MEGREKGGKIATAAHYQVFIYSKSKAFSPLAL